MRFCDAFNLPIVTLVDTPGFLPGQGPRVAGHDPSRCRAGVRLRRSDRAPVCVILRKAYGGAYIVMDSKGLGNTLCLAWPGAELAVMGAPGAVQILHRRARRTDRARLEAEYAERFLTPWAAAERGYVDGVIEPADPPAVSCPVPWPPVVEAGALAGRKHDAGPF